MAIPWGLIAPFAGVLADRWPKRTLLVSADLVRAAVVLGLVFAPNVWVLLALVLVKTTASTFFNPAQQATVRMTVPDESLLAANSLSQIALQTSKVAGPALGGLVVGLSSPRVALAVDAASFVASAAILSRLPREPAGGVRVSAPFWTELRAGLAYIASRRALRWGIAAASAAIFLVLMFDTLFPLALHGLGVNASLLGLAIGAIGLGAIVGAIVLGQFAAAVNPFALIGSAKLVTGAVVALIGIAVSVDLGAPAGVWVPALLVIGLASAGVLVSYPTILQRETPPELMGRVVATAQSLPTLLQLTAPLIGAAVAEWRGVGFVFIVGGAGLAALGAAVLTVRPPVGVDVPLKLAPEPDLVEAEPDFVAHIQLGPEGEFRP